MFSKFWTTADKYFVVSVLITIVSIVVILVSYFLFYNQLPNQLPLFYSLSWGGSQLATKQQFLLLPIILALICLVNSLITSQLHSAQSLLRKMLMFSLIIIDLIILITALKIITIFI
ncbi:MAG: hypothetical protein PHQ59_00985 [Candidatus Daviesbacteria bacterium]|nr:hypothetical protein [Candidatus Daviesbacteria bacterium]